MAAVEAPSRRPGTMQRIRRWRPHDNGLAGLRRASRVALVMPAAFAFAKLVIGDPQLTTFVAFGCFSLMVLADFGGLRPARAGAYLVTTAVGAVLVALGTLATQQPVAAALAMVVVGFWIQFAGVFGSYAAAAQLALMLAFVLSVSVPAPPAALLPRIEGWLLAGAVSTAAATLLWPRFERVQLRHAAAEACRALAAFVDAQRHRPETEAAAAAGAAATTAVRAARAGYSGTAKRPAGPSRRDRALVELLGELQRGVKFAGNRFGHRGTDHPCIEEGDRLAAAVVDTLKASGDVLEGGDPPPLAALLERRTAFRQAQEAWMGEQLQAGSMPEKVLEGFDADHWLRVLAYVAVALGANAVIAGGRDLPPLPMLPAGTPFRTGVSAAVRRVSRTIRAHLVPSSAVLRSSLRAGLGLALAVLIARLLNLNHAFWAVLGALSVLRSSAISTGRTTIEAVIGTLVGFVVGGALMLALGSDTVALWAALPLAIFLAAYTPSAIGFIVGQAAFTVLVLVLFNLISPVGWRLGLVRVEDVSIGVGISALVGLLLWPRGARTSAIRAAGRMYRAMAGFLAASFHRFSEGGTAVQTGRARQTAVRARDVAGDAFDQYMNERGSKPVDPQAAASVVGVGESLLLMGDLLNSAADAGYRAGACADGAAAVSRQADLAFAAIARLGQELEEVSAAQDSGEPIDEAALKEAALGCLRAWNAGAGGRQGAVAVALLREWVQQVDVAVQAVEETVADGIRGARRPWWSG